MEVLEQVEPSTRNKMLDIYVYFDKPESFKGKIRVPANFEELDADYQNELVEAAMEEKRGVWIDYWDYQ